MTDVKLSEIASGGALNPATDKMVVVRSGTTDVLTTPGSAAAQSTAFFLQTANNLSDVPSASSARTNLGLGSAATQSSSAFAQTANNLSDLASASTARTNLGLGTAATHPATDFLLAANNLSDLASASTARTNLGLGTSAVQNVAFFLQAANNLSDLANAATARTNLGVTSPEVIIASASTTDLGGGGSPNVKITGTTGITSFGSSASVNATDYNLRFTGSVTITNSSAIICPNGVNLSVVNGSYVRARYLGSGNWFILSVFQFGGGGGSGTLNPSGTITANTLSAWVDGTHLKTLPLAATSNLTLNGGSSLSINATLFNVRDFGAVGDNTTDDTTAFTNAITACLATTYGGVIYIPQGIYKLTSQISATLSAGQALFFQGDGPGVCILNWTAGTGGVTINFTSSITYTPGAIGAEGLTFQTSQVGGGAGLALISSTSPAVGGPVEAPRKRIHNCLFLGNGSGNYWSYGVLLDACIWTLITECTFWALHASVNNLGIGIQIQNSQLSNVSVADADEVKIDNCWFNAGTAINITSAIEGIFIDNSTISGNIAISWVNSTGYVQTVPLLTVRNCEINAFLHGIYTQNVGQMMIIGNYFNGETTSASCIHTDNTLQGNSFVSGVDYNSSIISDNLISFTAAYGIYINNANNYMITGNRIDQMTNTGIVLTSTSDYNIVRNNYITNTPTQITDAGTGNVIVGCYAGMSALVYQSSAQGIPMGTPTNMSFGNTDHDPLGIVTSATTLTVPAGVSKIKLAGCIGYAANVTGSVNIKKNGGSFPGQPQLAIANTALGTGNVSTPVLYVSPGDAFTLIANQSSGGTVNTLGNNDCWFAMEIIG